MPDCTFMRCVTGGRFGVVAATEYMPKGRERVHWGGGDTINRSRIPLHVNCGFGGVRHNDNPSLRWRRIGWVSRMDQMPHEQQGKHKARGKPDDGVELHWMKSALGLVLLAGRYWFLSYSAYLGLWRGGRVEGATGCLPCASLLEERLDAC